MAKKLIDISEFVKQHEGQFYQYFESVAPIELLKFIETLQLSVDIYIFSGIIRNYFLNINEARDFDFVIDDLSKVQSLIEEFNYKKNSFGGYKVKINNYNIDLWDTEKTWAFNYQKEIRHNLFRILPNTSFFNFSSIIYHINNKEFIFNNDFLRFLRDKEIDITYAPNPNYELCLINTIYYSEKYKLKIGEKLKSFIKDYFFEVNSNHSEIQKKHFGKVLYTQDEMNQKIKLLLQTNKAFRADV